MVEMYWCNLPPDVIVGANTFSPNFFFTFRCLLCSRLGSGLTEEAMKWSWNQVSLFLQLPD